MRAALVHSTPADSLSSEYQSPLFKRPRTLNGHTFLELEPVDAHRHKQRRMVKDNPQTSTALFACPFYKFDPVRYSRKDVLCSSVHLGSIPTVKEHLYRVHWTPHMKSSLPCSNATIRSASTVDSTAPSATGLIRTHGSKRVHDASKDLTDDQYLEIKVKRPREHKDDAWYRLYTAALPGAELPASPYANPNNTKSRFFQRYRTQGPEDFSRRIREQFRARIQNSARLDQGEDEDERTGLQEEVLEAAVTTVLEEFFRTAVRHEGGAGAFNMTSSMDAQVSPPRYSALGTVKHGENMPKLRPETPRSGQDILGKPTCSSASLTPLAAFIPPKMLGQSPDNNVVQESCVNENMVRDGTIAGASRITTSDNTNGDQYGYMTTQHGSNAAWNAEQQPPQYPDFYNALSTPYFDETAQPVQEDLEEIPELPDYEKTWSGLPPGDHNTSNGQEVLKYTAFVSQDFPIAPQGNAAIPDQKHDLVSDPDKRPFTKASGKAKRPMSCLTLKGPNRDKCPPGCQIFKSLDIYSIQRHERDKHGHLYSKHQEVLLAGLGKKKDAETRWLAHFDIIAEGIDRRDIDPYFSPSDFDDKITATSKATPSQLGNTFTPAGIARTQTYKILQDMVLESFDTSKTQIERHRQDTTSEITSHLHRVLDEHAERFCKEKSLAKCQAVSALRQDFDNGVEIKPEEVVARYTSQVSWSPFDVREVLADVGNAYPDVSNAYSDVSFLDADTTDS